MPDLGFRRFCALIEQKGYRATYRAPYRPEVEMTNRYLELDGWCYWFIRPNMLNRGRAGHRKPCRSPSGNRPGWNSAAGWKGLSPGSSGSRSTGTQGR